MPKDNTYTSPRPRSSATLHPTSGIKANDVPLVRRRAQLPAPGRSAAYTWPNVAEKTFHTLIDSWNNAPKTEVEEDGFAAVTAAAQAMCVGEELLHDSLHLRSGSVAVDHISRPASDPYLHVPPENLGKCLSTVTLEIEELVGDGDAACVAALHAIFRQSPPIEPAIIKEPEAGSSTVARVLQSTFCLMVYACKKACPLRDWTPDPRAERGGVDLRDAVG